MFLVVQMEHPRDSHPCVLRLFIMDVSLFFIEPTESYTNLFTNKKVIRIKLNSANF